MKLRQLTREDWDDISKLKFRDYKGKIIEAKIFENAINIINHPVVAIVQLADSYRVMSFALNGESRFSGENNEDIVIEEPEEVNYEEIVKELFVKNAFLKCIDGYIARITGIGTKDNMLMCNVWLPFWEITDYHISFDLKTFYTFEEYLELRRKQ